MDILFCNIAWMKYYKGIYPNRDEPMNGGSYVKEKKDAHEKYNFLPCYIQDDNDNNNNLEVCLGFFSTKSTNGFDDNQLHIEKIENGSIKEDMIDGVLVVWCAKQPYDNRTVVIGWSRDAQVYRYYQQACFKHANGKEDIRYYNVLAKSKNCVLLPEGERNRFTRWNVPRKRPKGASFGFGSANVWFGLEEDARDYIKRLIENINSYDGDNWIRRRP